jgi:hypothetical protein
MRYEKHSIDSLEKCYALSALTVDGAPGLLVAAEKHDPCYLYDLDGKRVDTVWTEPGGVMTMVPVPGKDGTFLATHKFYSPNDSAEAMLVCAAKGETGWAITPIAPLPFVHRFDIIPRNGVNYLLACTLKSGHEYKNDWRFPGKLLVGVLSEDPTQPLELHVLKEGLTHNHGYTRYEENGVLSGIVSCDEGVFQVTPPEHPGEEWNVEQLLDQSASDAVLMDLDGDGVPELFTISPFHGERVAIWHRDNGGFRPVYEHPEEMPFLHAIAGGTVYGRPTVYTGNREGERQLLGFYYDGEKKAYRYEVVDAGSGPANCMLFQRQGHPALLASNREVNEVAIYDILPE